MSAPRTFEAARVALDPGVTRIQASAGTGKTYALCALFLRLIAEEGLEVGAILVTTFTKPATAELTARIRALLRGAVEMFESGPGEHPLLRELHAGYVARAGEIQPRLERALRQFDDAAICTIHGFCQRLLRERAFESGVPFDAEAIEDQSALLLEVCEDFWRQRIYLAPPRVGALALLDGLSAETLIPLLDTCVARPTLTILPSWNPTALPAAESALHAAFAVVEKAWADGAAEVRGIFARAAAWAKSPMNKPEVTGPMLDAVARCVSDPVAALDDYRALDAFAAENLAALVKKKANMPPHSFFDACSALAAARRNWSAAFRREFLEIAPAALAERKVQRNVLSFDDLLTRLRDALRGGSGAALVTATRERFAAALVDEFQDTDPVQAEIFQRLFTGHGRLYFIGDPKQAIYGFRGADVFSYLAATATAEHAHELSANQRSTTPLVAAVNAIFSSNPRAFVVDGIDFHPAVPARRGNTGTLPVRPAGFQPALMSASQQDAGAPPPAFKFWLSSGDKPLSKTAAEAQLPRLVADAIVQQLSDGLRKGSGVIACHPERSAGAGEGGLARSRRIPQADESGRPRDTSTPLHSPFRLRSAQDDTLSDSETSSGESSDSGIGARGAALKPSDFAVLTASNRQAQRVQQALAAAGLPAVILSNESVFHSAEADDMLVLLQAIASPAREGALRAALATTALGRSAAELAGAAEDGPAWERLLERFHRHHTRWLADGFFPAFRELLVLWEVRPRLLTLPDGERRLTNLLHLAELLHQAATTQRLGPQALARWLATQMREKARSREEFELRLESDEDAVKVVTVHKSKGLEFGIVWCPFSWGRAALFDDEEVTFHDADHGGLTLDLGSPEIEVHRALAERERLAEHARLLYVALTRAKLQCHFVWGRFFGSDRSAASWVLHPPADLRSDPAAALEGRTLDDRALRDDLRRLAERAPGAIAIADLPEPAVVGQASHLPRRASSPVGGSAGGSRPAGGTPVEAGETPALLPCARIFTGTIRRDWAIGSFTSLTAGVDAEAPDYDRDASPADPATAASGIHAFPRGQRAGTCLHEIFEVLDFRNDAAIEPLVARKLAVFGFDRADFRTAVADCVRRVLQVPLAPGFRLGEIAPAQRLTELEFHLPVGRLDSAGLSSVLGVALPFAAFSGFLKGYIDLILELGGRFYIVDWKSNWLGTTAAEYTPEAIAAEMRRHHYAVQYHFYRVALHRHLRRRLGARYDYARHFGGVFYVFLRGVDPALPALGIFHEQPPRARIAALDALLGS